MPARTITSKTMTEKERFNRILKEAGVILAIGVAYFVFVSLTGMYVPCPIRMLTGYLCPGCGISHYFVHMAHLDFSAAFHDNQYIFFFVPIAIPYWIFKSYQYIKTGQRRYSKLELAIFVLALIAAILFGVFRNF